ncbi:hypothetical protein [Frigoribacterium sp. CG_9.8]|uniref:hypothetical protein n=1 Tax=Frigoribacterium sp. CG_9.8 TaxID=2787733 RepID=UPI0018CA5EAF|nr:hypothetical protein [Frigoribacterium sp. CG_9.8]MBG6106567.1 hypothetical protein [Frigoribacterium sp. CG_9.8]
MTDSPILTDTKAMNKAELRSQIAFLEKQIIEAGQRAIAASKEHHNFETKAIAAGYIPIELLLEPKVVQGRYSTEAQVKITDPRVIQTLRTKICEPNTLAGLEAHLGRTHSGRLHYGGYTGAHNPNPQIIVGDRYFGQTIS